MDALLQRLKFDEVGRLAADLNELAARPKVFLKVLAFARTMASAQDDDAIAPPNLTLAGGGHGALIDAEEGLAVWTP